MLCHLASVLFPCCSIVRIYGANRQIIKRFELHTGGYHTWKDKQEKILEEMERTLADMYKELKSALVEAYF